jgi:2-keto-4-pentenoate hydratase/2-oxohepta-3-ene-1,7-dioic acid hydratase in catechol pathway
MRIIRYVNPAGELCHAAETAPGEHFELSGDLYGRRELTARRAQVAKLLAPVVPAQVIGIGLNYRHHAAETGMKEPDFPVVFFKGLNSVHPPGEPVRLPARLPSAEVDYECELAVVIGRDVRNATRQNAFEHVLGYTCANDVSARDWQIKKGGGQWSRGKSFDTFCPLGPCLVTADEIGDPQKLGIRTILNGERVQDWTTGDMIFDVATLIEFLSADTMLPAGTIILTGTPHGVGMAAKPPRWLKPGDIVEVEIDRIGRLTNPIVAAETPKETVASQLAASEAIDRA